MRGSRTLAGSVNGFAMTARIEERNRSQPHQRTVPGCLRIRRAAIRLVRGREPGKRTAHRTSNVKDTPVAAQVAVSSPSRIPFQLVDWIETSFFRQTFRQAKSH